MTTLKNITLNNYTIDDFLKIKPIILEYCINLTQKRSSSHWFKHKHDAEDLYQDVFLFVYTHYFNKEHEPIEYGNFIQRMKNCTFWAYSSGNRLVRNNVNRQLNRIDDSAKDFYLFESKNYENMKVFPIEDITTHPDYNFYMRGLRFSERMAISKYIEGYGKTEIGNMFDAPYSFITSIVNKIRKNADSERIFIVNKKKINKKPEVKAEPIIDKDLIKSKVDNFDEIFKDDRWIKQYSLYLQGFPYKYISKEVGKSTNQLTQEIHRINKRVKVHGQKS